MPCTQMFCRHCRMTLVDGSTADGCPAIDAPVTAATTEESILANQPILGSTKLGDSIHLTAGRMTRKISRPKSRWKREIFLRTVKGGHLLCDGSTFTMEESSFSFLLLKRHRRRWREYRLLPGQTYLCRMLVGWKYVEEVDVPASNDLFKVE